MLRMRKEPELHCDLRPFIGMLDLWCTARAVHGQYAINNESLGQYSEREHAISAAIQHIDNNVVRSVVVAWAVRDQSRRAVRVAAGTEAPIGCCSAGLFAESSRA